MKTFLIILCLLSGWQNIVSGQEPGADSLRLSLAQALQEALTHNQLLQAAGSRVAGAEASLRESRGNFLPAIDAGFSYSYLDIVPGFRKEVLGNIEHDIFTAISVKQPLFTGGKLVHTRNAAQAGVMAEQFARKNTALTVTLTVALFYYQLQSVANQINILQENRRQLEVQQQYARLLVQAGRMSELELNRLRVEIANSDGILLKAENDYRQTSNSLGAVMGRDRPQLFLPADSLSMAP